jgi:hypothetical protein
MDFTANLLSFPSPTHTHDYANHNDGYGHPKTALVRSFSRQPEIYFFDGLKLGNGFRIR